MRKEMLHKLNLAFQAETEPGSAGEQPARDRSES